MISIINLSQESVSAVRHTVVGGRIQEGICQLCLQQCYCVYADSWDTTGKPDDGLRCYCTYTNNLTSLFWVILSSVCVGCSSVLSAILLFLQNAAMPVVTLAAANWDPNKYS